MGSLLDHNLPWLWCYLSAKALFENGEYTVREDDDETIKNMVARYDDIDECFPEELTQDALPFFIDWFKENVVIVEITAYSDDNAYLIFERISAMPERAFVTIPGSEPGLSITI